MWENEPAGKPDVLPLVRPGRADIRPMRMTVDTPLDLYEQQLGLITEVCADPWFTAQLAASRAGDRAAMRRISGSCLRLVLDIAKRKWQLGGPLDVLDLVQEGNNVLWRTLQRFGGGTADEFRREVAQQVEHWLTLLVEHPGLLD